MKVIRQILGLSWILLIASPFSVIIAQEKEAPKSSGEESIDNIIEKDINAIKEERNKKQEKPTATVEEPLLSIEKDIAAIKEERNRLQQKPDAAVKDPLLRKEIELQKAKAEVARLREWMVALKAASIRERVTMRYNMGCIYRAAKQYKEAEKEFLAALAMDPDDRWTHYNLGILYDEDLKDKNKAKEHYKLFVALSPDDSDKAVVQEWLSSFQ